jgi:methylisocitrate lyase
MVPMELMAAKVREAVAARRDPDFVIIGRTNAMRKNDLDEALRRGEAYRKAGADVLLLALAYRPEQVRAIGERLGGPLMYLCHRGGLRDLGMTLDDLGRLGYRIVADPSTALLAAFVAWKRVYADLADGFGVRSRETVDWTPTEKAMLDLIGIERLLAVERATVEKPGG